MVAAARPAIRLLPPGVAARIAAGEVIERPASVVKELLENALDAGARSIEVEVAGGGVERLRVRDDGCGIPPEQVADAFERHATSKLRSEHDLFAVRTLGFRGEALAAIAAAADVDLTTRPAGQEAAAVLRMRDGRAAHQGSGAAAPGTTVEVRDLFAALPARRRFLRAPRAEARAVTQVLADYALAYPEVAFRLVVDGRTALAAPGGGALRDAVAAVHGAEVADALLPVDGGREAALEAGGSARVAVRGAAGPPALHRASRGYIHLFANGRAITSRALTHAVERAYESLLPAGRHPVAVLHIAVPPEQVDVNVHPTKAEVRFRHERLVYGALAGAVRDALEGARAPAWRGGGEAWPPHAAPSPTWLASPAQPSPAPRGRDVLAAARPVPLFVPPSLEDGPATRLAPRRDAVGRGDPAGELAPTDAPAAGDQAPGSLRERLGALRALGQVEATYVVAEADDGLYLVDQHAAHERVLYEQVRAARTQGGPAAQPLLEPAVVELRAPLAALWAGEAAELAAVGWEVAPADGAAVLVRAVPAALAGRDAARALVEYLDRLEAEERLSGPDRAAATLACRAAVMAGDRLEAEQQRALLRALEACETPHTCPHGRPTMVHLSRAALERSFGRR